MLIDIERLIVCYRFYWIYLGVFGDGFRVVWVKVFVLFFWGGFLFLEWWREWVGCLCKGYEFSG